MPFIVPFLDEQEYRCPCCGKLPPDFRWPVSGIYKQFLETFSSIRAARGKPIAINSAYRCPKHNAEVGGTPLSVHQWGLALDLDADSMQEVLRLRDIIVDTDKDLRIGTYMIRGTFIHIDMGYLIYPRVTLNWEKGVTWEE